MIPRSKIKELRRAIRACAPANNVLNLKVLAKATTMINENIRAGGLSAKEILFVRDASSRDNLSLDNGKLSEEVMEKRIDNNKKAAVDISGKKKVALSANADIGHLCFSNKLVINPKQKCVQNLDFLH